LKKKKRRDAEAAAPRAQEQSAHVGHRPLTWTHPIYYSSFTDTSTRTQDPLLL